MVSIKGLQKTTLIDFPPYIACSLFFSGCNFRCGFCYNLDLVNDSGSLKEYSEKEILDFLDTRKGKLEGVCITGGEPTLYDNLKAFISKIKEKGFKVKLDTNGANPDMIKELISNKLIDYIAMDIKNSFDKYDLIAGTKVNIEKIKKSIEIIKNSDIDYEFRMTISPELHKKEDIINIGECLKGSKKFVIQQLIIKGKTLDTHYMKIKPYTTLKLQEFGKILDQFIDDVEIRNV